MLFARNPILSVCVGLVLRKLMGLSPHFWHLVQLAFYMAVAGCTCRINLPVPPNASLEYLWVKSEIWALVVQRNVVVIRLFSNVKMVVYVIVNA